MENININKMLNRETKENCIKDFLMVFENNKKNIQLKRGIYVHGEPGVGKTAFVTQILNKLGYDSIKYDAGDIRNKYIIDDINKHNMSDKNVMSMFHNKIKKIAIIMDEIDGMNNGDKGGINALIKIMRPKKTKKQKLEEITMNPIICIGNSRTDKKIKELMKVCNTIELKPPTWNEMMALVNEMFPTLREKEDIKKKIIEQCQYDLRKLQNMHSIYSKNQDEFIDEVNKNIFQLKTYNDDTKKIIQILMNKKYEIKDHNYIMNDTDRTSVGLLWHENIIDKIDGMEKTQSIPFYTNQLKNICFADYMDRITFQNQIWQFNEMSSLIKTMNNNKIYHEFINKSNIKKHSAEVRFTKVLTKYSTEYNNAVFIQSLCQQLGMDKKDLFGYFLEMLHTNNVSQINQLFENYEISKLDINRMNRYLDKYTKEHAIDTEDIEEVLDI
jgi:hypothetical protein